MTPRQSYILCATPRSGSTLLCSLLRSSGVAGQPESWFRRQDRADWAKEWGILRPDGLYDWSSYLDAARKAGTGPNGVCGLRLMWNTLGELRADLGDTPLSAHFGPLRYIHLVRRDLVAQAVSRHKAEVSGTWHLGFEEAEDPVTPQYDFAAILTHLREVEADNAAWAGWFSDNGLTPLRIIYEDLSADPAATARQVLDHLGLSAPRPLHAANRKMADAVSAEWATRFRAEQARQQNGAAV